MSIFTVFLIFKLSENYIILKNCAAKKGTESDVTNPKPHAILLTFLLMKPFPKHYCYIKHSDLSMHTYTHTLYFQITVCVECQKKRTI